MILLCIYQSIYEIYWTTFVSFATFTMLWLNWFESVSNFLKTAIPRTFFSTEKYVLFYISIYNRAKNLIFGTLLPLSVWVKTTCLVYVFEKFWKITKKCYYYYAWDILAIKVVYKSINSCCHVKNKLQSPDRLPKKDARGALKVCWMLFVAYFYKMAVVLC